MNIDELLESGNWKYLETPKWTFKEIIVSNKGVFYNIITKHIYSYTFIGNNQYPKISIHINGRDATISVPYVICVLFKNDPIKHKSMSSNKFIFLDGNNNNCSAENIRANYYQYDIVKYETDDKAWVKICNYDVLLNTEFINNELHKYNFNPSNGGTRGK